MTSPFFRHLDICNNTTLPGGRLPFRLGREQIGWVSPDLDPRLLPALLRHGVRQDADGLRLDEAAALPALGDALAAEGLFRHRAEPFDVRAEPDGPVLATLDRGALPALGIRADGVHLNGLVRRADGLHLWVGRRAPDKLLDPDKLDHIVAGGVASGHDIAGTLAKEGAEECGLPPGLARQARKVGVIRYVMARPEGLRRDRLHCFDLELPEDFQPVPHDGEVAEFSLIPLAEALALVRDTDRFKFNVNLVLIDLFLRLGLIDAEGAEGRELERRLRGG